MPPGYEWREGKLFAPKASQPVTFEILLNDPAKKKLALTWAHALDQLGITARVQLLDSAAYQARINEFNFDVIVYKWINTLSPGNEQVGFWLPGLPPIRKAAAITRALRIPWSMRLPMPFRPRRRAKASSRRSTPSTAF